jgi:tryptophanyl-tRNA synthetase
MTDNIGKSAFPAVQASPAFSSTFHIPLKGDTDIPCLIPCAIDQVKKKRNEASWSELN